MNALFALLLFAAEAPDLLARAVPVVEEACGAKFNAPPTVVRATEEEAAAAFTDDLKAEVAKLYPTARPGQLRTVLMAAALSSARSCIARYSPSRKAILVVRTAFDAQAAAIGVKPEEHEALLLAALCHEAVHALDDQRFDLAAKLKATANREALRALSMVVEGRATCFGRKAAEKLSVPEKIRSILPGGTSPDSGRELFLNLTYRGGAAFVEAVLARGGMKLADKAIETPPVLTHFLFHPDRWPDGEVDPRPEAKLREKYPAASPQPLSELELRTRYAGMDGLPAAEELFAAYRGGAQALVEDANVAVLAFADEESAEKFLQRSRKEVPADRDGTLVTRTAR